MSNSFVSLMVFLSRIQYFYIIFGGVGGGILICLVILGVFSMRRRDKNKKAIKKNEGNVLVYSLNLIEQSARYYNFYNLRDVSLSSYQKFIEKFTLKDRAKISSWIIERSRCDYVSNDSKNVMLSEYTIGQDKILNRFVYETAIVEIVGIDKTKQVLNLVINLLPNVPTKHERDKVDDFHKFIYEDVEVKTAYNVQDSNKGCLVNIKFYKKKNGFMDYNETMLKYLILNAICPVFNDSKFGYHYFWLDNEDSKSLFVMTNKATNIYAVSNLVKKIYPVLNRMIEVRGLSSTYSFVVTGAKRSELSTDFEKAKDALRSFSDITNNSGKFSGTYTNENYSDSEEEALAGELGKVVKNNLLNVRFSGIYKVTNKRVITYGYLVNPYLRGTHLLNLENFKEIAYKYDQIKDISSLIARKSVPTFNSEKLSNSNKLVIYINDKELPYVNRIYAHFNNIENTHIIFVMRNSNVANKEKEPEFFASINLIASRLDCEFYVDINVTDYILKDATYKLFDGFILNYKDGGGKKFESRDFIKVRNLCEKFLEFKKPIIAVNMNSWQEIEMLSRVGINTFSSDVIAEENENLIPISTKSSRRLSNMNKN